SRLKCFVTSHRVPTYSATCGSLTVSAAVTVATECHPALPTQHIIHMLVSRVSPHRLVTSVDVSHPDRISTSSVSSTIASDPRSTPCLLRC
uniref:Secreted protein n=1 Tax=Mesocestoides corti TaxID=53468 RepID=A0A5K3FWE7_MESCO